MRRDDQCCPSPPVECTPESTDGVLVERTGGLIEKEECRLANQCSREGELLDHACGAAVDSFDCDLADLELVNDRLDGGRGALLARIAEPGEEKEVRVSGKSLVERSLLAQRCPEQTPRLDASGLVRADQDPTVAWLERSGDTAE